MPHVDDGILHAHLDGALDALSEAGELPDGMTAADVLAHLRSCPDCSSRLRIEREMRERAGLVLADAAPAQFEMPPFPAAETAAPARRRRAWIPMSWAASMLVALGAGWWGSEIWRSTLSNESFTVDQAARQSSPMSAEDAGTLPQTTDRDMWEPASLETTDGLDIAPVPPASAATVRGTAPTSASEAVASNRQTPPSEGFRGARLTPSTDAGGTTARAAPQGAVTGAAPPAAANASNAPAADAANASVASPPPPPSTGDPSAPAKQTTPAVVQMTRPSDVQAAPPPVAQVAPQREPVPVVDPRQVTASSEALTVRPEMAAPLMRGVMNNRAGSADMTFAHVVDNVAFHRLLDGVEAVRFGDADHSDLTGRSALVFEAASEPVIETGVVDGQAVVRVRQMLATGEAVEVLSWQPAITINDIDLSAAAVSSAVERTQLRAQARTRDAPLPQREADTTLSTLSDGRRQIIARTASGQWIALRADLPATELRLLMSRLLSRQ